MKVRRQLQGWRLAAYVAVIIATFIVAGTGCARSSGDARAIASSSAGRHALSRSEQQGENCIKANPGSLIGIVRCIKKAYKVTWSQLYACITGVMTQHHWSVASFYATNKSAADVRQAHNTSVAFAGDVLNQCLVGGVAHASPTPAATR